MQKESLEETLAQTIDLFWETVPPTWNLIRGHLRSIASDQFDISVEQFHVLRLIRKGITTVSEIAEARLISRPAVSQAADSLVEKGLLTRRQEVSDRRFMHLALTPKGEDLLDQVFRQNRTWMMEKLATLNNEDLALIISGLQKIKTAFKSSGQ